MLSPKGKVICCEDNHGEFSPGELDFGTNLRKYLPGVGHKTGRDDVDPVRR